MAPATNPKVVTINGRLSYPTFDYQNAVARNVKSKFPKPANEVAPDFNILVEQDQLDKLVTHLKDEFLPYCLEQSNKGEKKDALDKKQIDKLMKLIDSGNWEDQPPYILIKAVGDKTQALAPECVANVKVAGNKGRNVELKAVVRGEDELAVNDGSIIQFPVILPLAQSVHDMYGGCYVAATINLSASDKGALPSVSGYAGVCVFKADGDPFGGGVSLDEDAIFADD